MLGLRADWPWGVQNPSHTKGADIKSFQQLTIPHPHLALLLPEVVLVQADL